MNKETGEQHTLNVLRYGTVLDVISGRCNTFRDKHGSLPARVTVGWNLRPSIVTMLVKAGMPASVANNNPLQLAFIDDNGEVFMVPIFFASISSDAFLLLHDNNHERPIETL